LRRLAAFDDMIKGVVYNVLVCKYGNYNYHSIKMQREDAVSVILYRTSEFHKVNEEKELA